MKRAKLTQEQKELQIVRQRLDRLDNLLFKAMEVLQSGEKWSVTPEGILVTVYPHPVISIREMRITGIKYSQNKKFVLPQLLEDRLDKLNADIKLVKKFKKDNPTRRVSPSKHKDVIARWLEQYYEGVTKEEIAVIYGVPETTISRYVNKYRKMNMVKETGE